MGLIVIPMCAILICIGSARAMIMVNENRMKTNHLEEMLKVLDHHLEELNEIESDALRRQSINQINK